MCVRPHPHKNGSPQRQWTVFFSGSTTGCCGNLSAKRTRTAVNESRLASWRGSLVQTLSADHRVSRFGSQRVSANTVGFGFEAHSKFDATAARVFIHRTVEQLLDCAGALLALGLDEVFPGAVIARFQSAALVDGQREAFTDKRASIARQLQAAFPGSAFELDFEDVKR